MSKKVNFEKSMARLEEIVSVLERGDSSLEESIALYNEGTRLASQMGKLLDDAEQSVTIITAGSNDEIIEQPFQAEEV